MATMKFALPLCVAAVVGLVLAPSVSHAKYSPEHPEVKALVAKGLGYLSEKTHPEIGGKALIALAFLKGQTNKNHPKIVEGVEAIKGAIKNGKVEFNVEGPVYAAGVSIILLCELDADKYRNEIQTLLDWMLASQKKHGGWGYPHRDKGDTSMTQYGVLSMWTAKRFGFTVPDQNAAGVCHWLLRTQDPSGGWGYQGNDPGNFNRIAQTPVTQSLTAAGTGSLYICGDILGLKQAKPEKAPDDGLPPGLQRVEEKKPQGRRASNLVDVGRFNSGVGGGNGWFGKNGGINRNMAWVFYYMYALERYMSFREMATFGKIPKESPWYDQGVEFLKKEVTKDGSWVAESGPEPGTCFAVLFLVRSTGKAVAAAAKPLAGELAGGKGLSGALEDARVDNNGKIVTDEAPEEGIDKTVDEIVASLGDPNFAEVALSVPKIMLPDDKSEREKQLEKLRKLVSAEKFEARMLAVRTLVAERSLDNAPVLIYALTDPDNRVVREARDGLRYISRRFDGFGMPDEPTEAQRRTFAERWRDWYYALRPEAEEKEEIVLP